MKALFARKTRGADPAGTWTGRVALRLRDWLDRYLEAKASAAPEVAPDEDTGSQGEEIVARAHPLLMGGGPPAHWLERVKAGAPQLLLRPEEGGTPWVGEMFAQNSAAQAVVPQQRAEGTVPVAAEEGSKAVLKRNGETGGSAQPIASRPTPKSGTGGSESNSNQAGHFAPPEGYRNDGRALVFESWRDSKQLPDPRSAYPTPRGHKRADSRDDTSLKEDGQNFQGRFLSRVAGRKAETSAEARTRNAEAQGGTDPAGTAGVQEDSRVRAMTRHHMDELPAKRDYGARDKAGFVAPSPAELWPEIFGQDAQAPVRSRFDEERAGHAQADAFPGISRRVPLKSSDEDASRVRSAAERRFPQIPEAAAARTMPGRHAQSIAAEETRPEDMRDLWPELPLAPDHTLMETGRAVRAWERAARLDREQRGEF